MNVVCFTLSLSTPSMSLRIKIHLGGPIVLFTPGEDSADGTSQKPTLRVIS